MSELQLEMLANTAVPFSISIFVADGDPDGLRPVERSNLTGRGVIYPRALDAKVRSRVEFKEKAVD